MSNLREAAQQALEALEEALEALEDVDGLINALLGNLLVSPDADAPGSKVRTAITALRAALAQDQDPELSAALGWPGGISDPVLDRQTLLQQVARLVNAHPA